MILHNIRKIVETNYNIKTIGRITIKDSKKIVDARKTYSILSKELTNCSLRVIGQEIERKHSIIIYYCRKASDHIDTDASFRKIYNICKQELLHNDLIEINETNL